MCEDNHPFGHDRPADPVRFDEDLFATYQDLIALRRTHGSSALLVTFNRSGAAHSARVTLPDPLRQSYETLRTVPEGTSVRIHQDGATLLLEVLGRTGVVLRAFP